MHPWKLPKIPRKYWHEPNTHKKFFDWCGQQLKLKDLDGWYSVTKQQVENLGGKGLLDMKYKNSLISALRTVYPEHAWNPIRFKRVPAGTWTNKDNHRAYMEIAAQKLNIKSMDDWYNVTRSQLAQTINTSFIQQHYDGSLYKALSHVYPEHEWMPWKFIMVPMKFWSDKANHRKLFDWIATQIGIKQPEDWYKVSKAQINDLGGATVLQLHRNSIYMALQAIYPETSWIPWKFKRVPPRVWTDQAMVMRFLDEVASKYHINQLDDWYRISHKQISDLGGQALLHHYNGLPVLLKTFYPNYPWTLARFWGGTKKSTQRWLALVLSQLFENSTILEDYNHPDLTNIPTMRPYQLDIYIPAYNLAIEYQGEHHFMEVFHFGLQAHFHQHDMQKRSLCNQHGIQLLEIPYWWDRSKESLAASILAFMPSLSVLQQYSQHPPIPKLPPQKARTKTRRMKTSSES